MNELDFDRLPQFTEKLIVLDIKIILYRNNLKNL